MRSKSGNVLIIIPSLIAVITLAIAGYFFFQNQQLQKVKIENVVSTPTPTPAPIVKGETKNWKTYPFLTGDNQQPLLGITYKLPAESEPSWVDAVHSYQFVALAGNTKISMIPSGQGMPLQNSWEGFREMSEISRLELKQITISGKQAIEISGTFASKYVNPSALGLVGKPAGRFRAVVIKASDVISIEVLHYQDANRIQVVGAEPNFDADEILFDQILRTFRFLE
ncbi:MAG: hypothetical protein AAB838_00795 [Patescibacteria group bacterium]